MGRGYIDYHLPESGRDECVLLSAFIHYRLADGSKLHILQQAAWCPTCDVLVIAEEVPSIESFEEEIRMLQAGDAELLRIHAFVYDGAPVEGRIAELRRRIDWRRGRISPPRCLRCGLFGVVPIAQTGEFPHPKTGERVVVGGSGWADTAPWFAEFSTEGDLLSGTSY